MSEREEPQGVSCPLNLKWVKGMLDVLPKGLRGKLEPFEACVEEKA